jgi:anti-sigma factor RsiW
VTCNQTRPLVEAIAAGDLEVEPAIRAHFESCPACASELASAMRLEAALRARPAPAPPPEFTAAVLSRVRDQRWRSEQHVDRIFNVAIAAAVLLVVAGIATLTNVGAVLELAGSVWTFAARTSSQAAQQALPTILTYVAAAGLLMSTLVMWWWAERRLSL